MPQPTVLVPALLATIFTTEVLSQSVIVDNGKLWFANDAPDCDTDFGPFVPSTYATAAGQLLLPPVSLTHASTGDSISWTAHFLQFASGGHCQQFPDEPNVMLLERENAEFGCQVTVYSDEFCSDVVGLLNQGQCTTAQSQGIVAWKSYSYDCNPGLLTESASQPPGTTAPFTTLTAAPAPLSDASPTITFPADTTTDSPNSDTVIPGESTVVSDSVPTTCVGGLTGPICFDVTLNDLAPTSAS